MLEQTVSHSRLAPHQVRALNEGGSTALGPAMTAACGYAASLGGGSVVLCTDGQVPMLPLLLACCCLFAA